MATEDKDLRQLERDIVRLGARSVSVDFGALVADEGVQQNYTSLSDTLKVAKQRGVICYAGDELSQSPQHDKVAITMLEGKFAPPTRGAAAAPPEEKTVTGALLVVDQMLQGDRVDDGQRTQLEYLRETLANLPASQRRTQRLTVAADEEECVLQEIEDTFESDPSTQGYLLAFGRRIEKKRTMREVAKLVRVGIRMKNLKTGLSTRHLGGPSEAVNKTLHSLDSWNDFDIFRLHADSGEKPLQVVCNAIIHERGLAECFHLPPERLRNFLSQIEELYIAKNPYHNSTHGADVAQTSHVLLHQGLDKHLSDLEVLSVVLASLAHDVGHPGVTNDYRVKSADEDAITYSDKSVNEYMHCAILYRVLGQKECAFLEEVLSASQKDSLRRMIVEAILGTDMAQHFSKLNMLKVTIEEKGTDVREWDSTTLALAAVVHASDLSNVCKPPSLALQWTERVLTEFFAQGDEERRLGYDISPLCDRNTVSKPGSQAGFMNFIVKPMFVALSPLSDATEALSNLDSNLAYWNEELAKEKTAKDAADAQDAKDGKAGS